MMQARELDRTLVAINGQELPDYPYELCDPMLSADYFTKFYHDRYLNSTLHLKASYAVQGAALVLFFIARKQNPIGTLPDDDEMLARLLRINLTEWQDLKGRSTSPLHGWVPMMANGKRVLGHEVVIEGCLDAIHRREVREASKEVKAVAARRNRLAVVMRECGCNAAVCSDGALVDWLDDWLTKHHHGQRRMPQFQTSIERGLRAAHEAGKFAGKGKH